MGKIQYSKNIWHAVRHTQDRHNGGTVDSESDRASLCGLCERAFSGRVDIHSTGTMEELSTVKAIVPAFVDCMNVPSVAVWTYTVQALWGNCRQ